MRFLNRNRMIIVIVSVIVLILLIGFSLSDRSHTTKAEQFTVDTTATTQRVIDAPFNFIGNIFSGIFSGFGADKKINELEAKLDSLPQLKADNERLAEENKELKEALDVSSKLDYESINARVISRAPDQWLNSFVIDKGQKDGIEEGMAVMTPKGLIGIVKRVNGMSSYVEIIATNTAKENISVEIRDGKNKHYGTIEKYDEKTDTLLVNNIVNEGRINKNAKVYTSGLTGDFPEGIIIGEVVTSENDSYGLSQNAHVSLASDIDNIDTVFVLKRDPESLGD